MDTVKGIIVHLTLNLFPKTKKEGLIVSSLQEEESVQLATRDKRTEAKISSCQLQTSKGNTQNIGTSATVRKFQ